jgi:hypothetical protein
MNKSSMNTRGKKRSTKSVDILLTDINKNSTCNSLKLPMEWTCGQCINERDMLLQTRSNKSTKQRHLTERNRCQQIWDISWSTKSRVSTNKLLLHNNVRSYLKVKGVVNIDYVPISANRKKKRTKPITITTPISPPSIRQTSFVFDQVDQELHDGLAIVIPSLPLETVGVSQHCDRLTIPNDICRIITDRTNTNTTDSQNSSQLLQTTQQTTHQTTSLHSPPPLVTPISELILANIKRF